MDIGANIGDTAIYFALNGAAKVTAFEPYPYSFELAKANVASNGLSGAIELHNTAVGEKDSSILLGQGESFGGTELSESSDGKRIEVVSLGSIAKKDGLDGALLKMDCEGSEYGIILSSGDDVLCRFSAIILEYHYGYLNLKARLEAAGFKVSILKRPIYRLHSGWKQPHARTGILLATRFPLQP